MSGACDYLDDLLRTLCGVLSDHQGPSCCRRGERCVAAALAGMTGVSVTEQQAGGTDLRTPSPPRGGCCDSSTWRSTGSGSHSSGSGNRSSRCRPGRPADVRPAPGARNRRLLSGRTSFVASSQAMRSVRKYPIVRPPGVLTKPARAPDSASWRELALGGLQEGGVFTGAEHVVRGRSVAGTGISGGGAFGHRVSVLRAGVVMMHDQQRTPGKDREDRQPAGSARLS